MVSPGNDLSNLSNLSIYHPNGTAPFYYAGQVSHLLVSATNELLANTW
jgi:hypothetical protein